MSDIFPATPSSCQWGTGVYTFPDTLTISDSCTINLIFSDIPFISVGILAFGVSFFFILIRRFSPVVLSLHLSLFFAFSASILDLGAVVAHGLKSTYTLQLVDPNTSTVRALIQTREIFLAISVGFRFLFYWFFVAEPPPGESKSTPISHNSLTDFLPIQAKEECHSGSWNRWGVTGHILKVGLLVATAIILAFQVLWRVVSTTHNYGPVYAADTSIELIASILFILKLILNTSKTPAEHRRQTLREYAAPIFALFMNAGIALGNLIVFAFTESGLGRFLQAIEYFVLIVFILFLGLKHHTAQLAPKFVPSLTYGLPEKSRESTFCIPTPVVPTPTVSMIFHTPTFARAKNASTEAFRRASRVSSWMSAKITRKRSARDDRIQLWDKTGARSAGTSVSANGEEEGSGRRRDSIDSVVSEAYKDSARWNHMSLGSEAHPPPSATSLAYLERATHFDGGTRGLDLQATTSRRRLVNLNLGIRITPPYRGEILDALDDLTTIRNSPGIPQPQDSPIYGLNGISRANHTHQSTPTQTTLDELIQQQNELDKSIAALRCFSPAPSSDSPDEEPSQGADLRKSMSTGRRTTCSEFSLSNFPEPPWLTGTGTIVTPPLPSLRPAPLLRALEDRRSKLTLMSSSSEYSNTESSILYPPRMPAVMDEIPGQQGLPESPSGEEEFLTTKAVREPRFDSGGTQYEITSFIGDLTTPGRQGKDTFSGTELDNISNHEPVPPSRPLPPPSSVFHMPPPASTSPLVPRRTRHAGLPSSPSNKAKPSPLSKFPVYTPTEADITEGDSAMGTGAASSSSSSPQSPSPPSAVLTGVVTSRSGRTPGLPPHPRLG